MDDKLEAMEKKFIGDNVSPLATRIIQQEYKKFQLSKDLKDYHIQFVANNFFKWRVTLDILKFDLAPELKADFESLGPDPKFVFELTFPGQFPNEPPFI